MIGAIVGRRVFAYPEPVDLRKGFDGLHALVLDGLDEDPLSGDLFLFVSRNRIRAKVLMWDGTGLCIYAKRLERGRFAALWDRSHGEAISLSASELSLFLEGCAMVGKIPLSPPPMDKREFFPSVGSSTIHGCPSPP